MGRAGDARPGGRLLGDRHDAGDALVGRGVDLLQERDRLEVLAAAVLVGQPLAGLARVVEVEHRGDGVDAQPVDVELLEPVQRVGDQEVAHLAAAEVEDERAPVRLLAAARVGVLVERGAVEAGQRPGVLREVRGHPVDDDADAGLVQPVDEVAEVVGVAEAGRRREVRRHLVAPGAAERVLGHRQELDVREAELADVVDELVGELAVGQALPPRAEVHLVDAHRRGERVGRRAALQPVAVVPLVGRGEHHRRGGRRDLGPERHRVGLLPPHAVAAEDLELVVGAVADVRDEQLPHAGGAERAHRVGAAVPVVEVAGDADALGVRRPDRERRAGHRAGEAVVRARVRAEDRPQLLVAALADQVQVDLAERRQEAVRVVGRRARAVVRRPRAGSPGRSGRAGRRPRRRRARAAAAKRLGRRPRR